MDQWEELRRGLSGGLVFVLPSGKSSTDKIRIIRGKLESAKGKVGKDFGVRPFSYFMVI
jgi:hypothetical protein